MNCASRPAAFRYSSMVVRAVLLSLLIQPGCGGRAVDLPETYEVRGIVTSADGTRLTGGLVELQSTTGSPVTTNGEIQSDGTFTLMTLVDGERLTGALPGTYRVVIMPAMGDQAEQQHMIEPVLVSQSYEVRAQGENHFAIEVDRGN